MGAMKTEEIIKNLELCNSEKSVGNCSKCTFASAKNCTHHLIKATIKHIKFLERELIDERDRYDRLVSFELDEAELLRAAKGFVGACVNRVFFTDEANESEKIAVFQLLGAECPSSERADTANASSANYPTSVTNGDNSAPTKTQNVVLVQFCKGSKKYLYALPKRSKVRKGMELTVNTGDICHACCDSFLVGGAALDALVELAGAKLPLTFVSGVVLKLTPDE